MVFCVFASTPPASALAVDDATISHASAVHFALFMCPSLAPVKHSFSFPVSIDRDVIPTCTGYLNGSSTGLGVLMVSSAPGKIARNTDPAALLPKIARL